MKYTSKYAFPGTSAAAIAAIESSLIPNGFLIIDTGPEKIELQGRGMNSTKEDPIHGATLIKVEAKDKFLHLDAELGGVMKMIIFLSLFPIVLYGALAVAPAFKSGGWSNVTFSHTYYGMGIWLVLGPAIGYWIRKRTIQSLENLLKNAATLSTR